MSTSFTQRLVSPPVAQPRGAVRAPALLASLARIGRAVWRELEVVGQARANSELQRLARLHAHRPEFAAALRGATRPDRRRG
jgi:hypothetical protein